MRGLTVASCFAGVGGSSLGYRQAGLAVAYANELNRQAAETYELNSKIAVDQRDVREVRGREILDQVGGSLDLLDGSPPCQGFSMIGARELDGDNCALYYEFIRLTAETRPRAFVAENVVGFAMGRSKAQHFLPILSTLRKQGYRVAARTVDASWLGVPQIRQRVILIGFRDDLGIKAEDGFPPRSANRTVLRDALPHAARLVREAQAGPPKHLRYRQPKSWPADAPIPTLTASGLDVNRYNQIELQTQAGDQRSITIDELRALSGFPPHFALPPETSLATAWRQFGNSVPPPMARAWATQIGTVLRTSSERTT